MNGKCAKDHRKCDQQIKVKLKKKMAKVVGEDDSCKSRRNDAENKEKQGKSEMD